MAKVPPMREGAILLTGELFRTVHGKTAHALVRGPSRYRIQGVVDPQLAGRDAGEVLDRVHRGIPIAGCLADLLDRASPAPTYCVVAVATAGGRLPPQMRQELVQAARAGLSLVNGLHNLLSDDPELLALTEQQGARIIDLRKPRPTKQMRFWSGESLTLDTPRVAVLGTDCAIGKRTTCSLLTDACRRRGLRAEMIYTGQSGWLQGYRHGFILDATPNDFVCGELEAAILDCQRQQEPDLILLEGQSALRNPSGPCGSEFIVSAGARAVILQHAPGREFFTDMDRLGCRIPGIKDEIALVRLLGAEVVAVTMNDQDLDVAKAARLQSALRQELALPVVRPLSEGVDGLVEVLCSRLARRQST